MKVEAPSTSDRRLGEVDAITACPNCQAPGLEPFYEVSDIPAHRAILDESSAILVEPNSATRLAAAIRSALRDVAAARQRADAALARVRDYTPELIAQRYLDVYGGVVTQPAAAASRGQI